MKNENNNIGNLIKKERKNRNLTQEDLGELIGYDRKTISKYECGTTIPTIDNAIKLCDLFQMSLDTFYGRESEVKLNIEDKITKALINKDNYDNIVLFTKNSIFLNSIEETFELNPFDYEVIDLNQYSNLSTNQTKINLCKIPKNVCPQQWIDAFVNNYCLHYNLDENIKSILFETFLQLYENLGIFDENWEQFASERSAYISMTKVYETILQFKMDLCDFAKSSKGRVGNNSHDAYALTLQKMEKFKRKHTIESRLFDIDGAGIDELCNKKILIFNTYGIEEKLLNFLIQYFVETLDMFTISNNEKTLFLVDEKNISLNNILRNESKRDYLNIDIISYFYNNLTNKKIEVTLSTKKSNQKVLLEELNSILKDKEKEFIEIKEEFENIYKENFENIYFNLYLNKLVNENTNTNTNININECYEKEKKEFLNKISEHLKKENFLEEKNEFLEKIKEFNYIEQKDFLQEKYLSFMKNIILYKKAIEKLNMDLKNNYEIDSVKKINIEKTTKEEEEKEKEQKLVITDFVSLLEETKKNPIWLEIITLIGSQGISQVQKIKEIMSKNMDSEEEKCGTNINIQINAMNKANLITRENINTGYRRFLVLDLTSLGTCIYEEIFKKSPIESETQRLIRENSSKERGYLIEDTKTILMNEFGYKDISIDRKKNTIQLKNGGKYIPDIVGSIDGKTWDYFEIEVGTHTNEDFNDKLDKMYNVTRTFHFIAQNEETLNEIKEKVKKWLLSKEVKPANLTIKYTTISNLNKRIWLYIKKH